MDKPVGVIDIDFSNINFLRSLMRTYGPTTDYLLSGENSDGDRLVIGINEDNIKCYTYQKNHWIRVNVYWYDGTVEELFEGKWD